VDDHDPFPTAHQNVLDHRAIVEALEARNPHVRDLLRVHLAPSAEWLALMRRASGAAA
jgi:DNA-binding FadR family transcriptional regulator